MSKVLDYDFTRYRDAMVERFGFSEADRDAAWADLTIILCAMETNPTKPFALTAAADNALHSLVLDTAGLMRFSEVVFGPGAVAVHDPFAYGTPQFDEGWANTRAAFRAAGALEPPANYRDASNTPVGLRPMACLIEVRRMEDIRVAA
ncbi:hypothetical protein [Azospirillum largimobile]